MSTISIEQIVTDEFRKAGFGSQTAIQRDIITAVSGGTSPQVAVERVLRANGLSQYVSQAEPLVTALQAASQPISEPSSEAVDPSATFDCDLAEEVLRAFIGGDYSEEEVDALLVLMGINDEPISEPISEPVVEPVDPSVFARLIEFAKRHGFAG